MESSKVVGEGTYGCVHKPPLNCKGKPRPPNNKVTKLMMETEAKNELKEYSVMEEVDPKKQYYLGTPKSCKVDINTYNKQSANKCKKLKENDPLLIYDLSKYKLLVMEDGGSELETFSNNILRTGKDDELYRFWLEGHRMFLGVKAMLDHGVIHHDLKPQNIVYNVKEGRGASLLENLGRMNFIDFGLMVRKSTVMEEAKKSKYGFSQYHWSFPLECKFLNKKSYDKFAGFSDKFKLDHLKNITNSLKEGESTEASSAIRYFLHYTTNYQGDIMNREKTMTEVVKDFGETLLHVITPGEAAYNAMLEKTLDTIDIYGLGLAMLTVLKNVYEMMDISLVDDLHKLFLEMTHANVMKRADIDTAIRKYEGILEKHNILKKYNVHFKNHILTEGALIPLVLEKKIETASAKSPKVSPKEIKEMLAENPEALDPVPSKKVSVYKKKKLVIRTSNCPEGKETNPKTRRCVKKCKEGETRNDKFECRKTQRKWRKRKAEKNMIE